MKRSALVISVLGFVGAVGCGGAVGRDDAPLVQQLEFDLTVSDDRARFREQDLRYRGAVGPYAVYEITGASPRLAGPHVEVTRTVGYAMLCGATKFFVPSKVAASRAIMRLEGGAQGLNPLVQAEQEPISDGECAPPKDSFGMPLPDGSGGSATAGGGGASSGGSAGTGGGGASSGGSAGAGGGGSSSGGSAGTGGSATAGGAGTGTATDPCIDQNCGAGSTAGTGGSTGGSSTGATAGGATGVVDDPIIQKLDIGFEADAAPRIGSLVLLRRVALTGARIHNDSHIIPPICCHGTECTLGTAQ